MACDSGAILCRKCLAGDPDEKSLLEYLDGYIASLPESIRAPEDAYKARLLLCAGCPHRILFTCSLCGCYIQARAAKKAQKCPLPGAPRWGAAAGPGDE